MSPRSGRRFGIARAAGLLLLGAAFVYLFVYRVGWRELLATLGSFDARYALPVLASQAAFHLLGGVALWVLARGFRPVPLVRLLSAYWRALVAGYWTPATVGEASLAWWLRPELSFNEGLALVTVDKAATLLTTCLLALPAVWIGIPLLGALELTAATAWAGAGVVAAALVLAFWLRESALGERLRVHLAGFLRGLDQLARRSPGLLAVNLLITLVRTVVAAGVFWLAIIGFQGPLGIGFLRFLVLTSLARLVSLVMPTPNGLGVFEVALVELVGAGAPDPAAVLSGALVARLAALLLVVPGFFARSPRPEVGTA